MHRTRSLPLLVLGVALALAACEPRVKPGTPPPTGDRTAVVAVDVTSRLQATVAGGGTAELRLVGPAAHVQIGLQVIFRAKQLVLVNPEIGPGPLTATLNTQRESRGTLSSDGFPAVHRQDFFLRLESQRLGTLVSDAPITMSAEIRSSPPTATYESTGGDVAFYKEGDPNKTPVVTVHRVTSDVKPARTQAVDITSRLRTTVNDRQVDLTLTGRAVHALSGTSVIFTAKQLRAVNPGDVGPLTVVLDPRGQSLGTLSSPTFPARHRQSFFLQIQSERLGTLVSDAPVTVAAEIRSSPPTATYRSEGGPVAFYRQDDPGKKPVLTIEAVESDVTPPGEKGYGR